MVAIEDICGHAAPAWAAEAEHHVMCDLTDHNLPGRWEQLWAERTGTNEYVLRSVPFFAYDLAPGDRITAADGPGGFLSVVGSVVEKAATNVLRVSLRDSAADWQVRERHDELVARLDALGLAHESLRTDYVSVACPAETPELRELVGLLDIYSVMEWADWELATRR